MDYFFCLHNLYYKKMKVSVVVPNYNCAKFLAKRFETIASQTYPPSEIIILDDCSTDNSISIIQNFCETSTIPYKLVINSTNSGSGYKQWQKGIELASHDLIWIAEADDFSDKRFLETMVKKFEDGAVTLAYCQTLPVDESGNLLREFNSTSKIKNEIRERYPFIRDTDCVSPTFWLTNYCVPGIEEIWRSFAILNIIPNGSATVFKKQKALCLLKNIINKNFKLVGDWWFYINIILTDKIAYESTALNYYTIHEKSAIRTHSSLLFIESFRVASLLIDLLISIKNTKEDINSNRLFNTIMSCLFLRFVNFKFVVLEYENFFMFSAKHKELQIECQNILLKLQQHCFCGKQPILVIASNSLPIQLPQRFDTDVFFPIFLINEKTYSNDINFSLNINLTHKAFIDGNLHSTLMTENDEWSTQTYAIRQLINFLGISDIIIAHEYYENFKQTFDGNVHKA